ncbi:MAG: YegP family protein [Marinirhabdus sp.]
MFELKKKGDNYHFVLKASNGQAILTSESYKSKASALKGIASVQKNSADETKFERKTAKNGKFFFNLKATNGQIVGSSQMYAAESGMNNGIESVRKNSAGAAIKEI